MLASEQRDIGIITLGGPHMKAFNDSKVEERQKPGLYHVLNDVPRAFEPFDEDDKIDMAPEQDMDNSSIIALMSLGTSKSSYCITQRGYFGRSPMPPRCVFYGAKVPFLLRPQATSGHYKLAGEICMHHPLVYCPVVC